MTIVHGQECLLRARGYHHQGKAYHKEKPARGDLRQGRKQGGKGEERPECGPTRGRVHEGGASSLRLVSKSAGVRVGPVQDARVGSEGDLHP